MNHFLIAAGDSSNDTAMLLEAHTAFFFRAPAPIQKQFPQIPPYESYPDLLQAIHGAMA